MEQSDINETERIVNSQINEFWSNKVAPQFYSINEFKMKVEKTLYDEGNGHVRRIIRSDLLVTIIAGAVLVNAIATIIIAILVVVALVRL